MANNSMQRTALRAARRMLSANAIGLRTALRWYDLGPELPLVAVFYQRYPTQSRRTGRHLL